MLQTPNERMRTSYNPSIPIKHMFKQIDAGQDLATDTRNQYNKGQLIGIAYDLIFYTGVLNNVCKEWRQFLDTTKTWENFKVHFADAHTELQEMQSAAQELNYGAGIVNNMETETEYGIQEQTANVLQALASATGDDRHAVANLSHTNVQLNGQVANLTKKVTEHDTQIDEL
eukprot:7424732-Ditylum_brightwellii.AAC.2